MTISYMFPPSAQFACQSYSKLHIKHYLDTILWERPGKFLQVAVWWSYDISSEIEVTWIFSGL